MTLTSLSLDTPILASSIPINAETVKYLVYEGDHTAVWDLRRKIVEEEEAQDKDILSSTLWTVQVASQSIHRLWLFHRGNYHSTPPEDQRLVKVSESIITPRFLYPCSEECSFQDSPCINCHSPSLPSTYTAARYLPRRPWRRPWNAFLDAVRAALIRGVNHSNMNSDQTSKRRASALKNGFIVADSNSKLNSDSDEWVTSGWEQTRPLLYVHIQIHPILEPSPKLIVHPTVLRTPYSTIGKTPIIGTALTLLPYGTPAYFMANYSGPTSALTAQFRDALRGLAVDGWEDLNHLKKNGKGKEEAHAVNYVIVFIPVHIAGSTDKKGLTVIYPSLLALAIPPIIRPPMDVSLLPTLPAPLQPSPMVPAAVVSVPPSVSVNGVLNSPLSGPRSAYQFPPPGPSCPPVTTNAFPTLNSPVVFGPGVNYIQLSQQQPQQTPYPAALYAQVANNSGNVGSAGANAPGPGMPFPLSTINSSTLAHSFTLGRSAPISMNSRMRRDPSFSNGVLLRAHRVVSTASKLSAFASPSHADTPAAVPTPGTTSAATPGGPSPSSSSANSALIPGSTTSNLHQTAAEISAYVEYVAKEREKERERLKEAQAQRGRMVSSGSMSNNGAATSANSNTNFAHRSVPPISIPSSIPPPLSTGSTMHPGPDAQLYYPSPPTNPPSVSAAGVAMSPTAYQDTALLPQIPQGLPSMHDTNIGSNRISPSGSRAKSEVNVFVNGMMDISNEKSGDAIREPLAENGVLGVDQDNTSIRPLAPIPAPEPEGMQSAHTSNPEQDSSWSYFDSAGLNFDGPGTLGTMSGIDDMTESGMTTDDINISLFGVGGGDTFNFANLNDFPGGIDWNLDSAFDLGSGSSSQLLNSGTGNVGDDVYNSQPTNTSLPSFQSANVFSQPMPPPMGRSITAPTQLNASGNQQSMGSGSSSGIGVGMDFEADFTDDDFNFFDNKSSNGPNPVESSSDSLIMPPPQSASAPPALHDSDAGAASPDPLSFLNPDDSSSFFSSLGLAPPLPIASAHTPASYGHPTPFSMSHLTPGGPTGFTPVTVDVEVEMDLGLPSPPEEAGHSTAAAYEVQLEQGTTLSSPFRSSVRTPLAKLSSADSPAPLSSSKDKKFSPIPFAKSHSQADGKYRAAGGKFALLRKSNGWMRKKAPPAYFTLSANVRGPAHAAKWISEKDSGKFPHHESTSELDEGSWSLPSPPVDSDITDSSDDSDDNDLLAIFTSLESRTRVSSSYAPPPLIGSNFTSSSSYTNQSFRSGWRPRYDRATDPRIGVIRRLAGCKQKPRKRIKRDGLALLTKSRKRTKPRWLKNWEDDTGGHSDDDNHLLSQDESAEDEEGETADEEENINTGTPGEMDGSLDTRTSKKSVRPEHSRPITPLPVYLPPGPSLISTCFHWVHLTRMAGVEHGAQSNTSEGEIHDSSQVLTHPYRGVGITHGVPTPVSPAGLVGASNSASPAFATTPTWPQALTPSADVDPISEEEKAWVLEATVSNIAQECVENVVWSDAWNAVDELMGHSENGMVSSETSTGRISATKTKWSMDRAIECVWPSDVHVVKQLLADRKDLDGHSLCIQDVFEGWSPAPTPAPTPRIMPSTQNYQPGSSSGSTTSSSSMFSLSPPLLSVAKSEAIIHIMPTALRFWDKLGLEPRGGKKDVTVFIIYEKGCLETEVEHEGSRNVISWRDEQIGSWLRDMRELYKTKHLGEMTLGKNSLCKSDGLVPFRFDSSFKKSLTAFISSLPPLREGLVLFILMPLPVMTLASETLHHVFSAVDRALRTYSEAQLLFQFVPEPHVLNAAGHSSSLHDCNLESFLRSMYNRISIPFDRAMSRKFFTYGQKERRYFEVPAFTLARPLSENKVSYSCSIDPALDVLDRHTFLHVGYGISSCGRWILASCIDQRGEAHALGVWSTQPYTSVDRDKKEDVPVISDELYIVNKVWDFAMQFAEKARVEWRIVFTKSGNMNIVELDAWITHLYTALHSNAQMPMHISLLNIEESAPWIVLPPSPQSTGTVNYSKGSSISRSVISSTKVSSKSQLFVDTSATTYALFQKSLFPVSIPPTLDDIGLSLDSVLDASLPIDDEDYTLADEHPLLPLGSSTLINVPTSSTSSRMVNIHLIYVAKSEGCGYPTFSSDAADSSQALLRDITNSFYSLYILSTVRWNTSASLLPFHLSAVDTMRKALSNRNGVDSLRQDS